MPTASEPQPTPEPPSPRRLLCAAQLVAQGESPGIAATLAGLAPATLRALRADPDFEALVEECRAVEAMPEADQDARLLRLVRRALERALADGRLGAIPAALRLLGLLPTRAPPGEGGPRPRRPSDDDGDRVPDLPPELAAAAQARWGMAPDGDGGWLGPDGRPAMPGREVEVVETERGPARLLDVSEFSPEAGAAMVAAMDVAEDRGEVAEFNNVGRPEGGYQWDPVTRTLWRWEAPGEGPGEAPVGPDRPRRDDDGAAGGGEPDLLGDGDRWPAEAPAVPVAPLAPVPREPAPPPRRPPAAALAGPDLLRARLDRLLATGEIPRHPDDLDLAEAVCSLLWPKWPRYQGGLSLPEVRLALAGRELDERALARLGGADAGPPFPTRPPPRSAKPRDGPPPAAPALPRARERPPDAARPRTGPRLEFSREHGLYLRHLGPWRP